MPSTRYKGFALIDCNNFYVSCERVFKPHLQKMPAVVLSNNDGCIIARSQEVKDLKIPMGAPVFLHKELIEKNKIHLFSPNFALYADMSDRVMSSLFDFSSEVQVYSIDEAFIPFVNESEEAFLNLRQKVHQWTGIPTSIGLGPTKTLAKLANYYAKKKRVFLFSLMDPQKRETILKECPVGEIWGVGRRIGEKLKQYQIYNAYQLQNAPLDWVRKKFHLPGMRTVIELRGTSCHYPEKVDEEQKSLTFSNSFGSPITSYQSLKETVVHYTRRAAKKLRDKKRLTQIISLYLKEKNGSKQKSFSLESPTNANSVLINAALMLLDQMYHDGVYKKAGIYFWDLLSEKEKQYDFTTSSNPAEEKLMKTLDAINEKYGQNTLFYAQEGFTKPWLSKRDRLSKEYTTKLSEILKIEI